MEFGFYWLKAVSNRCEAIERVSVRSRQEIKADSIRAIAWGHVPPASLISDLNCLVPTLPNRCHNDFIPPCAEQRNRRYAAQDRPRHRPAQNTYSYQHILPPI